MFVFGHLFTLLFGQLPSLNATVIGDIDTTLVSKAESIITFCYLTSERLFGLVSGLLQGWPVAADWQSLPTVI
jgi:hypothetical protein